MGAVSNPPTVDKGYEDGTYVGNDAANRAIPHSLGVAPYLVLIWNESAILASLDNRAGDAQICNLYSNNVHALTKMTSTNFYVGNAASYVQSMNGAGVTYYYRAFKQL